MAEQEPQGFGGGAGIGQEIADAQSQGDQGEQSNEYTQIAGMVSDLDRRLRILEERYGNLRKKLQLTDQNLIEIDRSFGRELHGFNDEILEMKRNIVDFEDKVSIFSGEMDSNAKKSDLRVVEKYLAMWDPRMFVTRRELREYLKSKNIKIIGDDSEQPQ